MKILTNNYVKTQKKHLNEATMLDRFFFVFAGIFFGIFDYAT